MKAAAAQLESTEGEPTEEETAETDAPGAAVEAEMGAEAPGWKQRF